MTHSALDDLYNDYTPLASFFPYTFKASGRVLPGVMDCCFDCNTEVEWAFSRAKLTPIHEKKFRIEIISYCNTCDKYSETIMVWSDEDIDLCVNLYYGGKWQRARLCAYNPFSNRYSAKVYLVEKYRHYTQVIVDFIRQDD